ncbi:MAG TPA: ABC transporter substrate-binding protein [Candidatus Acidoferrales bacterium]|jgi:alpha-glucoside transport system substrate-binding protein|nr:ABC transporter substrate-binding protein [Candidatus Acidoferrales bacterium]
MHRRPMVSRLAAGLAATALVVAACGSGTSPAPGGSTGPGGTLVPPSLGQIGGSVSIVAVWSGGDDPKSEQYAFMQVLKPFTDATGVTINYTATRDINAVLSNTANLPDIAGLPGPGKMIELAQAGTLKPLDDLFDATAYRADTPGASALEVDGKQYAEFFKGSIKGLIWYDPKNYTGGTPTSWDDLNTKGQAAATALGGSAKEWCIGVKSDPGSEGWPGTDWIEDILIRQSGPDVYDKWVNGTQKWTSPEIKNAWLEFGKAVTNGYGGATNIAASDFRKAGDGLFSSPAQCVFHHQASFITSFFLTDTPSLVAGTDYNFFLMPDINPQFSGAVTGGGDLLGMFHDTPQAKALMQYLISPQAQAIWPKIPGSGALSGSKSVSPDVYPDDLTKTAAQDLANAKIFRFDGSDAMPAAMSAAFLKGILDFIQDQSKLDSILASLDQVQSSAYGG